MYKTLIDCDSLLNKIDDPDWIIFDIRYDLVDRGKGKKEYLESHIPGAIYLDLHKDLSGPPVTNRGRHPLPVDESMRALFAKQGVKEHSQVIAYDNVFGAFAARLWWMLQHMQHGNVAVLDGGWQAWLAANGPIDRNIKRSEKSNFDSPAKEEDIVTIEQVEKHQVIIDSREPERYRGEFEPIDQVAGHIPGAINRFWKDNLSESGKFKAKGRLKAEFEQLFQHTLASDSVFYCGSGVTACHNLLAVAHSGLSIPKLYAGSWSEWSGTPGKPIAMGS